MSAKDLVVKPISSKAAELCCKRFHYSKKVAAISQIHLGVFLNGKLEGVMQFGPPIDRRNLVGLVRNTPLQDFLELNRMAFSDTLPKNSESRAISVAIKIIKKAYPHIRWIISFADGTQCGSGTIYKASGFVLTAIKKNSTIVKLKDGSITAKHGTSKKDFTGAQLLAGYQFRYIYFIDKNSRKELTVAEIPFSKIDELGVGMYKGKKIDPSTRIEHEDNVPTFPVGESGSTPTDTLHSTAPESTHEK